MSIGDAFQELLNQFLDVSLNRRRIGQVRFRQDRVRNGGNSENAAQKQSAVDGDLHRGSLSRVTPHSADGWQGQQAALGEAGNGAKADLHSFRRMLEYGDRR